MTKYMKGIAAAGLAVFILSGCSSSNTTTGLGRDVGGEWLIKFFGPDNFRADARMQLAQSSPSVDDPFGTQTLTGVINTTKPCMGSGTLTGTLDGNNIILTAATKSQLDMTGTANTNFMSGSWVIATTAPTTTTTTTEGTEGSAGTTSTTTTTAENCFASGGTWEARRG